LNSTLPSSSNALTDNMPRERQRLVRTVSFRLAMCAVDASERHRLIRPMTAGLANTSVTYWKSSRIAATARDPRMVHIAVEHKGLRKCLVHFALQSSAVVSEA
jgi:hypothetical protein